MSLQRHQFYFTAMASPCELQLYGPDKKTTAKIAETAIGDIHRIEQTYSRFRDDNLMYQINQTAAQGISIEVDSETAGLLDYAHACYQQSDGLFDISSGSLRKIWDFKSGRVPSQKQISQQLESIGWDMVNWNRPVLEFKTKGMEIDFGGIGKEYAADRAATICRELGIKTGLVDLGGDISIIGPRIDQRPWRVGIRDSRNPLDIAGIIEIVNGAVATSGDYQRYMLVNGKRYSHILNPHTGWPVESLAAVTVVAEHCIVAGSACTIAMLKGQAGVQWLENEGFAHRWVDVSGYSGGNLPLHQVDPESK